MSIKVVHLDLLVIGKRNGVPSLLPKMMKQGCGRISHSQLQRLFISTFRPPSPKTKESFSNSQEQDSPDGIGTTSRQETCKDHEKVGIGLRAPGSKLASLQLQ
jgi:hypothetical protein